MCKKIIFILLGVFLSQICIASEIQDRQQVFQMMKDYTKLTSCMNSFEKKPENERPTTLSDVHTVEYNK